jgi:hypothetical protein
MFQVHPIVALDLANQRAREAEALAASRRVAALRLAELRAHPPAGGHRRGPVRRTVVAALRALGSGAGSLARSACQAASRLEQGVA